MLNDAVMLYDAARIFDIDPLRVSYFLLIRIKHQRMRLQAECIAHFMTISADEIAPRRVILAYEHDDAEMQA